MTSKAPNGTYYQDRAQAELKMARKAEGTEAARAHTELAELYLERSRDTDPGTAPETDR